MTNQWKSYDLSRLSHYVMTTHQYSSNQSYANDNMDKVEQVKVNEVLDRFEILCNLYTFT